MTLAIWFWIAMFVGFVGGGWYYRAQPVYWGIGGLSFLLFLILGIAVFGSPIK